MAAFYAKVSTYESIAPLYGKCPKGGAVYGKRHLKRLTVASYEGEAALIAALDGVDRLVFFIGE